jgi:hypothetical protein
MLNDFSKAAEKYYVVGLSASAFSGLSGMALMQFGGGFFFFLFVVGIIVMSCTYLYYTYPQLLLLRTLYVLGNKPRFLLFLASFAVYLIPIIGWLYAIITPITVAFFLNLTDPRKVQLKLNLDSL